jgi:hypothetical protein
MLPTRYRSAFLMQAQGSVAKRLVLGALGGARAVERHAAILPPPPSGRRPGPCGRNDLYFAPPWQVDNEVRQRALQSYVILGRKGATL